MNSSELVMKKRKRLSIINKILFVILLILAVLSMKIIWFIIPLVIISLVISNNKCVISDIDKNSKLK